MSARAGLGPWVALASTALAGAVLTTGLSCGQSPPPAPTSPGAPTDLSGAASGWNVVLLTLDTVRADRLGSYGYLRRATSPRIDRLLESGVRFERAMAPRALTWPSLGSVLTGRYPSSHGLIENGYRFADGTPTLATVLHDAGYRTGAFLSNMCEANHQGFDEIFCSDSHDDAETVGHALTWRRGLEERGLDSGHPMFLWVHLFAAHGPYSNGGQLGRRLDPSYRGPLAPTREALARILEQRIRLGDRDLVHLDALYDAALLRTDQRVGALLDALATEGDSEPETEPSEATEPTLPERTLILLLADHGEELYEHHHFLFHACSVYQGALHVPLGLVAPGVLPKGARVAPPVELLDVAPTVLDLLGVAPPESFATRVQGASLVPYLTGHEHGGVGKPAFSEMPGTGIHTALAGGWKLIDNPRNEEIECRLSTDPFPIAESELYDLEDDPRETRNLAAERTDVVERLQSQIRDRFRSAPEATAPQPIEPELREKLRALGYVSH